MHTTTKTQPHKTQQPKWAAATLPSSGFALPPWVGQWGLKHMAPHPPLWSHARHALDGLAVSWLIPLFGIQNDQAQ